MANYKDNRPSFIVPYKGKSWRPKSNKTGPGASKSKRGVAKINEGKKELGYGITASNALDAAGKLLTAVGTPAEITTAKIVIGVVDSVINSLANNSMKGLPYFYQNSSLYSVSSATASKSEHRIEILVIKSENFERSLAN